MKKGTKYVACEICEACNVSTLMHTHDGKTFCARCAKSLKTHLDSGATFDVALDRAGDDYVAWRNEMARKMGGAQ